jgi:hypothetical protein
MNPNEGEPPPHPGPLPQWGRGRRRWQLLAAACGLFALTANAALIIEDFSDDPKMSGWKSFGEESLFRWDSTNKALEVTWDSSRTNSFFYLPLKTVLAKSDDFSFSFDLRLHDIRLGVSPGKTNTFEIATGLLNSRSITNANYLRGAGQSATYGVRNLVEFDYFPDAGVGATFASTVVSTNNRIRPVHNFPLEMTVNDLFRLTLTYTASNQILRTTCFKNGGPYGLSPNNMLDDLGVNGHPDFRVDAFGISSYSDANQIGSTEYWGSVLAHGKIDNVTLVLPPPALEEILLSINNSLARVTFSSRTNWVYTLERSSDARTWVDTGPTVAGTGAAMMLADTNGLSDRAFYKVRLERP